jgi:macrolide transport system ATP-binding/permease protein
MTEPNFRTGQLHLSGVSHGYGDRELFTGVELVIAAGEHAAVVGENGAGKSTLLRILAGIETPAEGTAQRHGRVGYLAQTSGLSARLTVADAIDDALRALREMEAELERLEDGLAAAGPAELEAYGNLQTQYQLREGYAAESRVEAALDRLGLGGVDRGRTLGSLSGGEQERVALACLLADPADILLLDEPTNHLDASGTAWLEGRLAAHRGAVVVVSHDRVLLRKVAAAVIEVDAERRTVNRYGNGYDGYLKEKRAERQRWVQQYHGWIDAMAAERRQADTVAGRMGYARRRDNDKAAFDFKTGTWERAAASKIRNAQERLRRLEDNPVERPPERLKLDAGLDGGLDGGPDPAADSGGGAGGSSSAGLPGADTRKPAMGCCMPATPRCLAGWTYPSSGWIAARKSSSPGPTVPGSPHCSRSWPERSSRPRARWCATAGSAICSRSWSCPSIQSLRLLPAFAAGLGGNIDTHAEALLRLGLFRTSEFHVPVGALSAGQQRRLALARLLLGHKDVMLLDEPSNHLAPALVEELESALAEFDGTVVMVSHDRALGEWFDGCADRSRGRAGEGASGRWLRYTMADGMLEKVALPA